MRLKFALIVLFALIIAGCAELRQIAEQFESPGPLTNQEVVDGLKQALTIGADSAASRLSATDGYYRDKAVRIMLPPEAQIITENLSLIPGGDKLVEDLILRINRSAENAAREAAPVFAAAVRNMSIRDGFAILRGESDAATSYLRSATWDELYGLYQPRIKSSVDRALVGNISTAEAWDALTGQWNRVANSAVGRMSDLKPVNVELDRYLTERALDGLFLKLAEQEEIIRTNPAARVTDLLRRVFGQQD
ncbi:MAG: DUF4197 domain-containing protein [Marinilabiliales bacterium]|nr:MAG: DUF4197 domain-containing protein [Marinilabiliales bacterium]